MNRKHVLSLSLAALLAGATFTPQATSEPNAQAAAAESLPVIRVVAAERRELVETLSVNGTIVAREEAAAGADLGGLKVMALHADIGDLVREGDVLAELDRSMLDTELARARASRAQAEASVAQMRAQIGDAKIAVRQADEALGRASALQKKGVAAKADLDNAVNGADSARARLVSAEKALAAAEAQLGVIDAEIENVMVKIAKTEVRAPADGVVLARDATLGAVVNPGGGPLFRIAIGAEFELAADVAETSLPRLQTGMPATVALAGATGGIEGSIRRIAPEIDKSSRLGAIRIALSPGSAARAGNFARGEIEIVRRSGVAVPSSAVIYKGSDAFLQTISDGRVSTAPVSLGARTEDFVEIVSGIGEGTEVVSRAGTFVADGDRVAAVREERTGGTTP